MKFSFQYRAISSLLLYGLSSLPACAAFSLILLFSSVASARLSGDASLTYTSYDGRANGARRMSSNSLVQDYSLLYSTNGVIYNNRVGRYDVSLGYNWTVVDTTFRSSTQPTENYSLSRGHILYNGEIVVDPKEIPIRLNAYSRDMNRNTINTSTGRGFENFGSIFGYRDQATSINDGLHIESGVTLLAGVKNGMTNGYNEILRHFPMILIDYKDTVNRDLGSMSKVNDRLSRLAFVSLNKKDNWFHYRHTQYNDYIYTSNSYVDDAIQLGTVDQYMARRWIDFSNWLKVSTDLQFSKRKSNNQQNIEDINLNLFVAAERTNWNARTFTTFNRHRDENSVLTYETKVPLYAAGVVSQDISWNARTSFRDSNAIDVLGVRSKFTDMLVGYRVDAFKRSPFTLSQSLDVESSKTDTSDLLMISGTLETASTPRFSRNVSLGASYTIKNSLTSPSAASSSDFLEQKLDLSGGYAPTNTLRFEVRENVTLTTGNFVPFSGSTRDSGTQLSQYLAPRNLSPSAAGSESLHSVSSLRVSWNPKPRLNTYLAITEDLYKTALLGMKPATQVMSGASFTNDVWNISNTLKYTHGNLDSMDAAAANADSISNSFSLKYIHSRNLDASASYSTSFASGGTSQDTTIEQRLNYNFYTRTGIARKLLEINEVLMYASGPVASNSSFSKSLALGFKYYPISRLTLVANMGYAYTATISDYTFVWNASAAANFRLLQASLDYVNGIRKIDGARESKFTGNIRKAF